MDETTEDTEVESHENWFEPSEDDEHSHPIIARKFGADVTIKARNNGVMMYAVYDGYKQVSAEVGPLDGENIISYAEGYARHKKRTQDD